MRSSVLTDLLGIALITIPSINAAAQTYAEHIVGGFRWPMLGTHVPGDANRLFVSRVWTGEIQIVDLVTRTVRPDPFLVVSGFFPSSLEYEQGLLGLAFDPDYATNGYFYVNYTGADNSLNVRRYRVLGDPATSNVADPDSGQIVFHLPKQFPWHNGGWIGFGPNDGYLYITVGDPGGGHPQTLTGSLHGKVLRIDVRGDDFPMDPLRNYAIPPTNPFVGKEGDDEIWAYGLRNPWQASFDRVTGDLWINDVGELRREEVNFQPASSAGGENYGWPQREGSEIGPYEGAPLSPEHTEPIYDYARDDPDPRFGGTVIGGSGLYRGPVAAFYGHYLFTDYGNGNIWKLDPDAVDPRAAVTNINELLIPDTGMYFQVAAFGEAADGNMYIMGTYFNDQGDVFRIATHSKDAVWNGDDGAWGLAGDGSTWGSALNWTRGNSPDEFFVGQDNVIFGRRSSQQHVYLGRDRTVAALTFQAPYTLHDHKLQVLSGNVTVRANVAATIASDLTAETANHSIRKLGAGTLLVEGHAGQIVVKEGTLGGTGSLDYLTVRSGGTVSPGVSAGVLTVLNSFSMESGATLAIEIRGIDNSNHDDRQFDQLYVGGAAVLAGMLEVAIIDSDSGTLIPSLHDVFPILFAAEGISGWFDALDLPALPTGLKWKLDSNGFTLSLRVTTRLPGDYNGDGTVNTADYVVWRNSIGETGGMLAADGTGPNGTPNGIVGARDYQFWKANYGATESSAASPALTVCGPHTIRLILVGVCILLPNTRDKKDKVSATNRTRTS